MEKVFSIIKSGVKKMKGMWSRRAKEYTKKKKDKRQHLVPSFHPYYQPLKPHTPKQKGLRHHR